MTKRGNRKCDQLPVLHPHTTGIDAGASELLVAVNADRDLQPIRRFPVFTHDLRALADWLQQCGARSVAMESTSVYWIPIYQILEVRGLDVCQPAAGLRMKQHTRDPSHMSRRGGHSHARIALRRRYPLDC